MKNLGRALSQINDREAPKGFLDPDAATDAKLAQKRKAPDTVGEGPRTEKKLRGHPPSTSKLALIPTAEVGVQYEAGKQRLKEDDNEEILTPKALKDRIAFLQGQVDTAHATVNVLRGCLRDLAAGALAAASSDH